MDDSFASAPGKEARLMHWAFLDIPYNLSDQLIHSSYLFARWLLS